MLVRTEQPGDRDAVFEINATAFPTTAEARLVDLLRDRCKDCLSLVAEEHDTLAGHILFTPVSNAGSDRLTGLGPVAVRPERQGRGIGGALIERGLELCAQRGDRAVFLVGEPGYYGRFGFRLAAEYDLHYKDDRFDPWFMVKELVPGSLDSLSGLVGYLPEFDEV